MSKQQWFVAGFCILSMLGIAVYELAHGKAYTSEEIVNGLVCILVILGASWYFDQIK